MTVNQAISQLLDLLSRGADLDAPAISRINATLCGAIDREIAAMEERRMLWKLKHGAVSVSSATQIDPQLTLDGVSS